MKLESPASGLPAGVSVNEVNHMVDRMTSTIALDNIYRKQNWLKHCARQLVSAANVSTPILFPVRRSG
jgi:hypothetical protein